MSQTSRAAVWATCLEPASGGDIFTIINPYQPLEFDEFAAFALCNQMQHDANQLLTSCFSATAARPCTPQAVQQNDCPIADSGVGLPPGHPNSQGMCKLAASSCINCTEQSPLPIHFHPFDALCIVTEICTLLLRWLGDMTRLANELGC